MRFRSCMSLAALAAVCYASAQSKVISSFVGTSNADEAALGTWYYPPDTEGVMGKDYFVQVMNSTISIYDRAGTLQSRHQLTDIVPNNIGTSDNRLKYDLFTDRYFLSTTDYHDNLFIGVSKTGNPNDGFNFFDVNPRTPLPTSFADFPTMSVTKNTVNMGLDLYASTSDFDSAGVNVISIKKSDLVNNTFGASSYTSNFNSGDRWNKGSYNGVDDLTNTLDDSMMLSSSWWNSSVIHSDTVHDTGSGYSLTDNPDINVGAYAQPGGADQLGTATLINTNDARLSGTPVYQNGMIWTIMDVDLGGTPGLQWNEINASTGTVVESGTIGNAGFQTFFGSIAVNEFGELVVGFSGSDANSYGSAYAMYGTVDGLGHVTFDNPLLLKAGTGVNISGRWGDYSETVIDPLNHHHFWTTQEYATGGSGGYGWGSYVAEIGAVPEPATMAVLGLGALGLLRRKRRA